MVNVARKYVFIENELVQPSLSAVLWFVKPLCFVLYCIGLLFLSYKRECL